MNTDAREFALPSLEEMVCYVTMSEGLARERCKLIEKVFPDLYQRAETTRRFTDAVLEYLSGVVRDLRNEDSSDSRKMFVRIVKGRISSLSDSLSGYRDFSEGFRTAIYATLSRNGVGELSENDDDLMQALYSFESLFVYYWDVTYPKVEQAFAVFHKE